MTSRNPEDQIGNIPISPTAKRQHAPAPAPAPPDRARRRRKKDKHKRTAPPSRIRRLILALAGIILVLFLGVYLLIPYLLTRGIPQYLGSRLHRSITVGDADFSLVPPMLTLRHGIIGPRTDVPDDHIDPLLSFSDLSITLSPKALLRGKIACRQLTVGRPFFHLVLYKNGSSNLSVLLSRLTGSQQPQSLGRPFTRLLQFGSSADIDIDNGQLLIEDEKAGKHHDIKKIVVRLPAGTLGARSKGWRFPAAGQQPKISAVIDGNPVTMAGLEKVTPAGPVLDLRLQINNTNLMTYAPYIPEAYGYRVLAGRGDLQLDCLLPRQQQSPGSMQLSATLKLSGLRMQDAASTEIAIGTLELSARYLPAKQQLVITNLSMDAPSFSVTRRADGTWSFPGKKLLPELEGQKPADPQWRVDELSIHHGTALFTDLSIKGGFTRTIDGLALSLHGLHSVESLKPTSFNLQAGFRPKATVTMAGQLHFSPFSGSGMLLVDNLPLPTFTPYLAEILGPATLKNGTLEKTSAAFSFTKNKDGNPALTLHKAKLLVEGLDLAYKGGSYQLPSVKINGASLDPAASKLEIGQLEIPDLQASLPQNDLLALTKPVLVSKGKKNATAKSHWQTSIHQAFLQKAEVRTGENSQNSRLFSFSRIDMADLDNSPEHGGKIAGRLSSAGGTLQFAGQLFLSPLRTELRIILDDLPLRKFPEFWAGWLNLPVQTGILQAKGRLRLPQFSFTGGFGISDFKAGAPTPSLAWHQLIANSCSLTRQPFSLIMKNVALDRPYLQWIILGRHRSNLINLIKEDDNSSAPRHSLEIDDITIQKGRVDFADHALSPPYLTHCERIDASIDTLSNEADSRSHLSMNGMLPGDASLSLEGDFGFLAPMFYADFTSNINDLNLLPLSPYTEPILGYTLRKGLLNMRTTFHEENGIITADNKLKLSDLKLGRRLQSLSQLPLTIALLTAPDGTVELDIPVRGKTADPSFSFHDSFFGTLQNLVLRTAVSPFSVLNALIPKHNALDLDHVSFDFGESKLSHKAMDQLAEIARAVKLRPWLAITIRGEADAQTDLETLIVQQKQREAVRQLQQERQLSRRLSSQYGKEVITPGNPKNAGNRKNTTEALQPPGKKELAALARERARAVYKALKKQGLSGRQLHLADRVLIVGADAASRNGNRVSLSLASILPL